MSITPNERLDLVIGAVDWLLTNPDKQTTGRLARDEDYYPISPFSPKAACFCLVGRLMHDGQKSGMMVFPEDAIEQGETIFYGTNIVEQFLEPVYLHPHRLITVNDRDSFEERQTYLRRFLESMIERKAKITVDT